MSWHKQSHSLPYATDATKQQNMHKDVYILYILGLCILYILYIICAHFSFQGRDSCLQRCSMVGCDGLDKTAEYGGAALIAPEQLLLLHVMLR